MRRRLGTCAAMVWRGAARRGQRGAAWASAGAMAVAVLVAPASAQSPAGARQDVPFQVTQTTSVGQSVFVLGDLPELGASDLRRAVKLEPSAYPQWRATISLPAGRTFTYRYYLRNDAPGQGGNLANGTPISGLLTGRTASAPGGAHVGKAVLYHSAWAAPVLHWRQDGLASLPAGQFLSTPMVAVEPGRTPDEWRYLAQLPRAAEGRPVQFFITDAATNGRDPASGVYTAAPEAVLLQHGQLYTYLPAASVSAPRRDYAPSSPPTIVATNLFNETRRYRVVLPRGYAEHTGTRYPVLYMHDGQNVFEVGPFGSWNAFPTLASLTSQASMREIIVVAIDNGPNRIRDYAAADNGGWGDRYLRFVRDELKPRIDARYRTIPDASATGLAGSSMGAQISLYGGWDFGGTFTRLGCLSGAYTVGWNAATNSIITTSAFYDRVRSTSRPTPPGPAMRLYLDSGDSGTASDNYWQTFNLRDNLLGRALPPAPAPNDRFALHRDVMHTVGLGQQHNEAAWAARLPGALQYLYPIDDEPAALDGYRARRAGRVVNEGQVAR